MPKGFQVIARRWRPQQFDEIVGQEHIVQTLKNAITTGRIGHAYLFVGPRGTGKTTTARIFAKALNCVNGPSISPAPDDPICKSIVDGSCMDVIEIDAATNRGVDNAKQIRDECYFTPTQCRYKIYIIDEVHQLTNDAFNALLKVIEEPPEHIKFIFATTEADKVIDTITSRCQRFEFQPIPEEKIAERLKQITSTDGVDAEQNALLTIARLANGGMRDSQSILDQVISFCGKKITEKDISNIYGLASTEEIKILTEAIATVNFDKIIQLTNTFVSEGKDLKRIHSNIQQSFQNILLETIQKKNNYNLSPEQILRICEALNDGERNLKSGLSVRSNFEISLLKAATQGKTRAIDTLIKEISKFSESLPENEDSKKK